mmetsp:Transcript_29019/g.46939  ORF Transcript_29019/g.46939 Transcript_29019/m.46939 type:complete len:577 (-) Transcript_29019:532-2262(-)
MNATIDERWRYFREVCGYGDSDEEDVIAQSTVEPDRCENIRIPSSDEEDEGEDNELDAFEYDFSLGGDLTKKLTGSSTNPNAASGKSQSTKLLLTDNSVKDKFYSRIHLDNVPHSIHSDIRGALRKEDTQRQRVSEKADRATVEQVLDPRTRMILFKMLHRGTISEINGCISTGKEANVYHALNSEGREFAIKVYKTSILVFKDRDRYVSGDFRFRRGYSKHNPRKMVRVWAEKETKNLARLQLAGIPSPEPIMLRSHVLVMTFMGKDGWAAPRLKEATLSEEQAKAAYSQCVRLMRVMYQKARLVHGDLSEYNILYYNELLYFIDVSQSVEHDHPHALDFLRKDCDNIVQVFGRMGVPVMSVKQLFDFITDVLMQDKDIENFLEQMEKEAFDRPEPTHEEQVQDAIFRQSYIPSTLEGVRNCEKDADRVARGDTEGIYYRPVTGLSGARNFQRRPIIVGPGELSSSSEDELETIHPSKGKVKVQAKSTSASGSESVSESDEGPSRSNSSSSSSEEGEGEPRELKEQKITEEPEISKKERKKLVKQQRREKLATKVPKAQKKRKEKQAKVRRNKKV